MDENFDWTPEDRAAFAKMGHKGAARRRANIGARIDAAFPHLSAEDRARLTDREYRTVLREQGRAGRRLALSRKTAA